MFVQSFNVLAPRVGHPNHEVGRVLVDSPVLREDGSVKQFTATFTQGEYGEMMGLDPPLLPGGRSNGDVRGVFHPLEPQLETRPAPRTQPQIQHQIELVVPPVNEPLIPNIPEEFGVE